MVADPLSQSDLDTPIVTLDKNRGSVGVFSADEKADQAGVTIACVAHLVARRQGDARPDHAVFHLQLG